MDRKVIKPYYKDNLSDFSTALRSARNDGTAGRFLDCARNTTLRSCTRVARGGRFAWLRAFATAGRWLMDKWGGKRKDTSVKEFVFVKSKKGIYYET